MAELNERQKAFARLLATGVTQSKAYRQAFDCEGRSAAAVRSDAFRLAKNADVLRYVAMLSQRADRAAVVSRQERMERLSRAFVDCHEAGNIQDMVRCCQELNKMDGGYVQPEGVQVNVVQQQVTVEAVLRELMGCIE
ncbi:MAG: hypothetical protein IJN29_04720 [Akkermansia sp.]|nr:hypothetical protein [Akkermansia sp.]